MRAALPVALIAFVSAFPAAADVISQASARHLARGILSVTHIIETAPNNYLVFNEDTPISIADGDHHSAAARSGSLEWEGETYSWGYAFDCFGADTATGTWRLTHTGADDRVYIAAALFFLFRAPSVFDDGTLPSSPGSEGGLADAEWLSGPAIFNTNFDYLWYDPINRGDLFQFAQVQWAELPNYQVFPVGTTAEWRLDTDLIPAPWTSAAFLPVLMGRRRRIGCVSH